MAVDDDILDRAWKMILAVGNGDWSGQTTEWQYNAEKWRLEYFRRREVLPSMPPTRRRRRWPWSA